MRYEKIEEKLANGTTKRIMLERATEEDKSYYQVSVNGISEFESEIIQDAVEYYDKQ